MSNRADVIVPIPEVRMVRGSRQRITLRFWANKAKTTPFAVPTSGWTAGAVVQRGQHPVQTFTVDASAGASGVVHIIITEAVSRELPPFCWWFVRVSSGGSTRTLGYAKLIVEPVTP